jgi:hypothetical protein
MPRLTANSSVAFGPPGILRRHLATARAQAEFYEGLPGYEQQLADARATVVELEAADVVRSTWPDDHVAVWSRLVAEGLPMADAVVVARGVLG